MGNTGERHHKYLSCDEGASSTLPGFRIFFGSRVCLIARMTSIVVLSFTFGSRSRFSWPIPCSAEIEPFRSITSPCTMALISSQRAKNAFVSAPMGCETLQ